MSLSDLPAKSTCPTVRRVQAGGKGRVRRVHSPTIHAVECRRIKPAGTEKCKRETFKGLILLEIKTDNPDPLHLPQKIKPRGNLNFHPQINYCIFVGFKKE